MPTAILLGEVGGDLGKRKNKNSWEQPWSIWNLFQCPQGKAAIKTKGGCAWTRDCIRKSSLLYLQIEHSANSVCTLIILL
jgi:hypothetical protein